MTKQLFLTLALLFSVMFGSHAQTAEKPPKPKDTIPYEVRYNKLKKLYIKMLDSQSHKNADSIAQVFFYKITPDVDLIDISKENNDYFEWAKANLSKTEFRTQAEAEKLWGEYEAASKISVAENKEYYDYVMQTLHFEDGIKLHMSIMKEVRQESPEKYKRIKLPKRPKKKDLIPKVGPLRTH